MYSWIGHDKGMQDPVTQGTVWHSHLCVYTHSSEKAVGGQTYDCWYSSPAWRWPCGPAACWVATVVKCRFGAHWWWARWPGTRSRWSGGTRTEISAAARGPFFYKKLHNMTARSELRPHVKQSCQSLSVLRQLFEFAPDNTVDFLVDREHEIVTQQTTTTFTTFELDQTVTSWGLWNIYPPFYMGPWFYSCVTHYQCLPCNSV